MKQVSFKIKNRVPTELQIEVPEENLGNTPSHPLMFVTKMHDSTETYLNCAYDLLRHWPKGMNITELFGGIGIFAKMLWPTLEPASYTVVDLDPNCKLYSQEPRANYITANAHSFRDLSEEAVIVEIPTGTIRTLAENMDGRKQLFDRIKEVRPKHLQVTDCGYYWVHLQNHKPWYVANYGKMFGFDESITGRELRDIYHFFYADWFKKNMGYEVLGHRTGGGAQYYSMEPI